MELAASYAAWIRIFKINDGGISKQTGLEVIETKFAVHAKM